MVYRTLITLSVHMIHRKFQFFMKRSPVPIIRSGPEAIQLFFSCSAQLSIKFSLLINTKMISIVGISILFSRDIFVLTYN